MSRNGAIIQALALMANVFFPLYHHHFANILLGNLFLTSILARTIWFVGIVACINLLAVAAWHVSKFRLRVFWLALVALNILALAIFGTAGFSNLADALPLMYTSAKNWGYF